MFQSTPPRGGRRGEAQPSAGPEAVSIHAPARGATSHPADAFEIFGVFQSTPPRGGRQEIDGKTRGLPIVSIHAPARGATWIGPTRQWQSSFQSTPPRGGRRAFDDEADQTSTVSIHAPARGATVFSVPVEAVDHVFQSTPPRGGRQCCYNALKTNDKYPEFCAPVSSDFRLTSYSCQRAQNNNCNFNKIQHARNSPENGVRLGFTHHAISGPSWSTPAFAPTCSTRRLQFDPR